MKSETRITKGCGKFRFSCFPIIGGWCGITNIVFTENKVYCKECRRKRK